MKHYLSVCAVVRDEAPYLAEWITFHLLQGVEHFYLYLNDCKDKTWEILVPYINAGVVTETLIEGTKVQLPAYQQCLDAFGEDNEWIAFIDVDEFLHSTNYPLQTHLKTTEQFGSIGGVAARWWLYGSNGHKTQTDGLVIERFTKKARYPDKHVKSIIRPSLGGFVGKNPHSFRFPAGIFCVDTLLKKLPEEYAIMLGQTADNIRINHYHTKSKEEYMQRKRNPDVGSGVIHSRARLEEMFHAHDLNDIEDTYLKDNFAEQIKAKIKACGQ